MSLTNEMTTRHDVPTKYVVK